MISLFSEPGRKRLDDVVHEHMLCVFDFDGTLSPIVPQADQAYLPHEVKQRLQDLMQHVTLGILTGRSLQDIRPRLGFDPHYVLGNHGIEGLPDWEASGKLYRDTCLRWERMLKSVIRENAQFDRGIWIENKQYSLSLHYRQAKDPQRTERQLAQLFSTLLPDARVVEGKFVYSLLPPGAEHKGSAMEKLMALTNAGSAIYVGDDITDEDVFRLKRPDILTIKVEPSPDSAAELYLPHLDDMTPLLDELLRRLRQSTMKAIA
jgi:trehalose 6-phosphate phosphatase